MFLNKDGKIFLGDSGVYILAILSSLSLIFIYNTKSLFVEVLPTIYTLHHILNTNINKHNYALLT